MKLWVDTRILFQVFTEFKKEVKFHLLLLFFFFRLWHSLRLFSNSSSKFNSQQKSYLERTGRHWGSLQNTGRQSPLLPSAWPLDSGGMWHISWAWICTMKGKLARVLAMIDWQWVGSTGSWSSLAMNIFTKWHYLIMENEK